MQTNIIVIGLVFIIIGIIIMVFAILRSEMDNNGRSSAHSESKGIVLIGPIPIVWGFGKRNKLLWIILFTIFLIILIVGF